MSHSHSRHGLETRRQWRRQAKLKGGGKFRAKECFGGGQDLFKRITNTNDSQQISHNFDESQTNWGGGANLGAGHKFGGANAPPCPPLAPPLLGELQSVYNELQF